jgi:hypothetical protein
MTSFKRGFLCVASVVAFAFTMAPSSAQTYVSINNLLFSEDFSSYEAGTRPTTVAEGGLWETSTWGGPGGSVAVVQDSGNIFGKGTDNKFFQVVSTTNVNLVTPNFAVPQEVITFSFDFIGHVYSGDGNRWVNIYPRAGGSTAHITSMRMYNATIRTDASNIPANPSYGGNDLPFRVVTVFNNRADTISYDRPDGVGTADLSSSRASVWLYHYTTETWQNVLPEFVFGRTSGFPLGDVMDNLRILQDSGFARSFDMDNIEIYGSLIPEPSTGALLALFGLPLAVRMFRRRA